MDKLTMVAFEKLQKREHRIRSARNQLALGRITKAAFTDEVKKAEERYALTFEEQQVYENHLRRARKTK